MTRRTTSTLVETAISAAVASGRPFTAIEVRSGGVVRILFGEPDKGADKEVTCDEAFGVSD
jgi:hypothetical protein